MPTSRYFRMRSRPWRGGPAWVQRAVVVDRGHREVPIKSDYVGKNIPTSRDQQVDVRIQETDGRDEVVVLDAEHGPIYIDDDAEIHPFTRLEGPCYIGKKSILLGAKCREGNSIGPMCRIGGEVAETIIQGYSNKYHDCFLGQDYVG